MEQLTLSTGWQLKKRDPSFPLADAFADGDGWITASVPGTVHQDLLAAELIPDPFIGLHELEIQWVGESDWLYRCQFDVEQGLLDTTATTLCFDGLDTFATVWLNGRQILTSDNMFVPQRVEVKSLLQAEGNELWVLFESAMRHGKEREAMHGKMLAWNGDPSRVYNRKAQYHYGWDWGPCLLTAGPWRAVRLEAYDGRITELHCSVEVSADLQHATLPLTVAVEGALEGLTAHLALYDPAGELAETVEVAVENWAAQHTLEVTAPHLWWPLGHGEQPLYRLVVTLRQDEVTLDQQALHLGLRRLRLVQESLDNEPGTSFLFEINNTPLFCGGANWIPADSFTPRVTAEQYRSLLQLAADANMTMLRIWGGGIYEEDIFYDLCDELGLLVWQDFMFACGFYPAHDWFQASVRVEAEAAVRRLRHHPSIVLWCGNNEDHMLAHIVGVYQPNATTQSSVELVNSPFPARAIYEQLLPDVCAALDPTRPYWPGSPFGGADPNDGTVGDRHTWDVWHDQMAEYRAYPTFAGRFVSEFGMQAMPHRSTIESFTTPAERYAQSRTLEHHNKASDGPRRLAVYLNDTLRWPDDLDGAIYSTQFVQSEAVGTAIRGWRRRWGGAGAYAVAGALVWQLNDCWPVTSWAVVDYAHRPKPAYYTIRRELAPVVVGLAKADGGAAVWEVNGSSNSLEAQLMLSAWKLDGTQLYDECRDVILLANQSAELGTVALDAAESLVVDEPLVVGARLVIDGVSVSRAALWPEPFKYLTLPDPGLELIQEQDMVRVRVQRPAKGVWLSAGDGVQWSDNMLDLLPDDEQIIVAHGLGDKQLNVRWLT